MNYSGVAEDENGKLLTGVVGATFATYAQQGGGAALWIETQNVLDDDMGSFSATGTLVGTEAYSVGLISGTFGDFYCHHGLVGGGTGVCYFADVANDSGPLPNSFSQAVQFDSVDSSGTDIFTSIRSNPQNSIEISSGNSPGTSFGRSVRFQRYLLTCQPVGRRWKVLPLP